MTTDRNQTATDHSRAGRSPEMAARSMLAGVLALAEAHGRAGQ
jgi:hypothetical protein